MWTLSTVWHSSSWIWKEMSYYLSLYKLERTVGTNLDLGVCWDVSTEGPKRVSFNSFCWQKRKQNSMSSGPQSPLSGDWMTEMTQTSRLTRSLTDRGGEFPPNSTFCKWSRIFNVGTTSWTHLIWTPKFSVGIKTAHFCTFIYCKLTHLSYLLLLDCAIWVLPSASSHFPWHHQWS